MSDIKYCRDCKHRVKKTSAYGDECSAIMLFPVGLVRKNKGLEYCYNARSENGKCGEEATLFEPKTKWWKIKK